MSTDERFTVELTTAGYVRLDAPTARRYFPGDALVAATRGDELWLIPLVGPANGGLLLKQRTASGDRAALVREALPDGSSPTGMLPAVWDAAAGAVRVSLSGRA